MEQIDFSGAQAGMNELAQKAALMLGFIFLCGFVAAIITRRLPNPINRLATVAGIFGGIWIYFNYIA